MPPSAFAAFSNCDQRLLFGLAEEGAAAGQRQDDIDLPIGGLRRGKSADKRCGNKNDADAQSILPIPGVDVLAL